MACKCPKCGRPRDCHDELCVMCELIGDIKDKAKNIVTKVAQKISGGKL